MGAGGGLRHSVGCVTARAASRVSGGTGERPELVSGAVLGDQALTMHRAKLAAEPAHVDVDRAAVTPDVPPVRSIRPYVLDQVRPAEHRGRMRAEEGQQLELLESQHDLGAVNPEPALDVLIA